MNDIKTINLTQGKAAIVDEDHFEELSKYKWTYSHGYALRRKKINGKSKTIYMHRFIMDAPTDMVVDHINRDRLDNRKVNLRVVSHADNLRNTVRHKRNTSGFRGVHLDKKRSKWVASIHADGTTYYIGSFDSPTEAAKAYNQKATEMFGDLAYLNNINESEAK